MRKIWLVLFSILFLVGCSKTGELENTIAEQEKEIEELQSELEKSEGYASILETHLDEMEEEEKDEAADETTEEEVEDEGESVELNPGTYIFGEDVEPGRYTITFQDDYSGSIFFRGEERFGENFGMRDGYIYDYTFNAYDGEQLETRIPVILFPK